MDFDESVSINSVIKNIGCDLIAIFTLNTDTYLRGHEIKLKKKTVQDLDRSNRNFSVWNNLHQHFISSQSVNCFENKLCNLVNSNFYTFCRTFNTFIGLGILDLPSAYIYRVF